MFDDAAHRSRGIVRPLRRFRTAAFLAQARAATGRLSAFGTGRHPMGTQPNWIEIVDLK